MPAFKLPEFYVPWPARINPHLDSARAHSKAWAREVGILEDGGIWSESAFDRHDYALLCAYIHPETPADELNLMADWNVWAFYVDDFFLQVYKQQKDRAGAKTYLDRMLLFMPVELSPSPSPTNPMERALANLWQRTAPTKSAAWRARIFESTRTLLQAFLWELDSMNHKRLANPIEYIEMRRQVGAALWSADLVEHAMFVEIPERIVHTRPMQVLKNTFADGVHLRNDIFSYDREVLKEGELTNAVLVFERFLNVSTQQAADLTNDLLTSRLQQFEHTVLTELTEMFQEYALDPLEQMNVLNYIRGLQDWQSGAHEWHIQTSRYLNPGNGQPSNAGSFSIPGLPGFSTAAMRITPGALGLNRFKNYTQIPYKKVGPTRVPKFYMPFMTRINPNLETARRHSREWARQMGMLDALPDHPEIHIWDERKFDATELAFFTAGCNPTATADALDVEVYWLVWGTYVDDYFFEVYGRPRDLPGAKIFRARLWEFMPIELTTLTPLPNNPIERGLADVWVRITAPLPIAGRHLFRQLVDNMIGSWVMWELPNQIQRRIPDPIDYFEMRRKACGADFLIVPPRFAQGSHIPPEVHQTLTMHQLNNSAVDYAYLSNDIVSYQKEIEFEGDIHNGVLVIENFLGCTPVQAIEIVNNLMTARLKQFEHIVENELPILFENFNMNTSARQELLDYVEELKRFVRSTINWDLKTARYDESELRHPTKPFAATAPLNGFGTSVSHILNGMGKGTIANMQTPAAAPKVRKYAGVHHTMPFKCK